MAMEPGDYQRTPIYAVGERVILTTPDGYQRTHGAVTRVILATNDALTGLAGEPMYEIAMDNGGDGVTHERYLSPE